MIRSKNNDVSKMVSELDTSSTPTSESKNKNIKNEAEEVDDGIVVNGTPKFLLVRCKPDRQTVFTFHRYFFTFICNIFLSIIF